MSFLSNGCPLLPGSRTTNTQNNRTGAVDVNTALEACNGWGPYQWRTILIFGQTWFWFGFFVCCGIFTDLPPDEVCVKVDGREFCHEGLPTNYECEHGEILSLHGKGLVVEFGLVCDGGFYTSLLNAVYFIGHMILSCLIGGVADKYGRAPFIFWIHAFKHSCRRDGGDV